MPAMRMAISTLCMRGGNRNVTKAASASSKREREGIRILRET